MQSERKRPEAAVSDEPIHALRRRLANSTSSRAGSINPAWTTRRRSFCSRASGRSWKISSTGVSDVSTAQMVRPQRG